MHEDIHSINFYPSIDEYEQVGTNEFKVEYYTPYNYSVDKDDQEKTYTKEATIVFEEAEDGAQPVELIYEIQDAK